MFADNSTPSTYTVHQFNPHKHSGTRYGFACLYIILYINIYNGRWDPSRTYNIYYVLYNNTCCIIQCIIIILYNTSYTGRSCCIYRPCDYDTYLSVRVRQTGTAVRLHPPLYPHTVSRSGYSCSSCIRIWIQLLPKYPDPGYRGLPSIRPVSKYPCVTRSRG